MRTWSRSATRKVLAALVAIGGVGAATTAPASAEPALYRVRAGSNLLACGSFAGGCYDHELHGTLELDITTDTLEILDTDLFVTAGSGVPFPFPAESDLQLAGLEGPYNGHQVEIEASNEHGQSARLLLQRITRDLADPAPQTFVLQGTYDEACCDRFVYDFGNVFLDRVADRAAVHLDGDRFERFTVRVHWQETPSGPTSDATPQRTGPNAAQFWFFEPDNPEIFVKLVNACETEFDAVWVFVSGLTDLGVSVVVTDTETGLERVYDGPAGQAFAAVTDTSAFSCSNV